MPTAQEMMAWKKLESEHTSSPAGQAKIVMDHVCEHGIGYYPELIKMEARLDKSGKK